MNLNQNPFMGMHVAKQIKIGRNDPCWCKSGKKYKQCHMAMDEKIQRIQEEGHIVPSHSIIKNHDQIAGIRQSAKINIAVLDAEKLNQGFVVFCSVKLRRLNRDIAAEFTRIIQDIPEVTECYNISGSYDYLLKIHAPNMKYYQEFILNVLGTIDSLGSLESTFVMAEVKHQYGIHI